MDISEEGTDEEFEFTIPTRSGEGTIDAPFTVEQYLSSDSIPQNCWIIGYAVGSTYRSMSNAVFSIDTLYNTNIILADDTTCENTTLCVPVELKNTSIQERLSLQYQSQHFHDCVMVFGTCGKYFYQLGLRNVTAGYWLEDFDIKTINPSPQEWEEVEYDF